MYKSIILILLGIVLISCTEKKKQETYNPKAIELNNKGVGLMKSAEYDSALIVFDRAIETDKNYYLPHSNKTGIYIGLQEFDKALTESDLAIRKKPDFAEGWIMAGLLHEKLGDSLTASSYFQKSVDLYDKLINDPANKDRIVKNKINRAFAIIIQGKEKEGKEELSKLKAENPDNIMIGEFLTMNKDEFVKQLFGEN
ncbi:MAG: hypothetical protein WAO52_02525 [Prolixibacteraceae bacterium]